ncbi:MAG: DUF4956 domain-containing protein [Candidatus Poribacteria bacterium]|nr:DUF4956 domain-containing protein [Candidatus Poribacteria bacterium]
MQIFFDFLTLPPLVTLGADALRVLLSFALSVFIVNIYLWTHAKVPQKSFTDTLIILCMLISVVMVIIGDSIARAFSLVGALSIIRFRTAIQDPRDIGFVFYALGVGMAVGAGNPSVAILATFLIGTIILCMYHWHLRFGNDNEFSLEFCLPPDKNAETVYRPLFDKYLIYERLLEQRIKKTQQIELTYRVRLANPQEWLAFFNELSGIENVTDVKMDKG